jgi:pSer/pThr/pTyr-binding forkhead associated (FHA) protein
LVARDICFDVLGSNRIDLSALTMDALFPNSHILLIETTPQPCFIELTAAVYTIGRSANNDIVLPELAISRRHAMLVRIPSSAPHQYSYQLVNGDNSGKPSLNGIKVNHQDYTEKILNHMDEILFGGAVHAYYYMRQDISTFKQEHGFSQHTSSQKETQWVNAKQTICTQPFTMNPVLHSD